MARHCLRAGLLSVCLLAAFPHPSHADLDSSDSLLGDGNFSGSLAGLPSEHWKAQPGQEQFLQVKEEDGVSFLRIGRQTPGTAAATQIIDLPEGAASIRYGAKLRGENLTTGAETYERPRVLLTFMDESGQVVGYVRQSLELVQDSPDWVVQQFSETVPEGATQLRVQPGLFGSSGTFDVTDLSVVAN